VVQRGATKIAAFRDEAGTLHEFSARCTHLGCSVHWNSAEQSFDCPCHGSRFSPSTGEVLTGPALHALEAPEPPSERPERNEELPLSAEDLPGDR